MDIRTKGFQGSKFKNMLITLQAFVKLDIFFLQNKNKHLQQNQVNTAGEKV